jgi:flagellar assembly protein FliH
MSSSSRLARAIVNVPPPPGSRAGSAYTRFIPREELQGFSSWTPGAFDGPGSAARPAARLHRDPPQAQAQAQAVDEPGLEQLQAQFQSRLKAEVQAARQAGYQDGYRDGLVALENFKQTYAAQVTGQFGSLLESFAQELSALEATLATAVARTAVKLAQQVVRAELRQHPEQVARVAGEAVESVLLSARQLTVLLHPADLPLVASGAAEAIAARGARLQGDPQIARGGCRVESDVGHIDADLATRWAQAAAAMGHDEPWEQPTP